MLKPHDKKAPPSSKTLSKALELPDDDFTDFIRSCFEWYPFNKTGTLTVDARLWTS